MDKAMKIIRLISLILLVLVIATCIAGTVLMFMDKAEGTYYTGGEYSYYTVGGKVYKAWIPPTEETYSYYVWKSGIMPLIGTLVIVASGIFLLLTKRNRYLSIGAVTAGIFGSLLLYLSEIVLRYDSTAYVGYYICVLGASLNFLVVSGSSVILLLLIISVVKEKKHQKQLAEKYRLSLTNLLAFASEIRDAKALFDGGVFSEEQYSVEKARIFASYGFISDLPYTSVASENASKMGAKTFDPHGGISTVTPAGVKTFGPRKED